MASEVMVRMDGVLVLVIVGCAPEVDVPAEVGDVGLVASTLVQCRFCHGDTFANHDARTDDPMSLVDTPSVDDPAIPYVTAGDPMRSMVYLKMSGAHAILGLPGDVMVPSDAGVQIAPEEVDRVRSWILGANDVLSMPPWLGDVSTAQAMVDRECVSCHLAEGEVDLSDLEALVDVAGEHLLGFPLVAPGQPWASGVYRVVVRDHAIWGRPERGAWGPEEARAMWGGLTSVPPPTRTPR